MTVALPPPVPGTGFDLETETAGRVRMYRDGPDEGRPILLVHSVNAAGSAYEVRPIYTHFATSRPTYAIDLPGFGASDRSDRNYTPRLMTDAVHAACEEVRRRHEGAEVDLLGLSLASEFVARKTHEHPDGVRTLALVSPTGFAGSGRKAQPEGSTRAMPNFYRFVSWDRWDAKLYGLLVRPRVIRYFLEKTWGSKDIDEGLFDYDVLTTQVEGAQHAPLRFVSGYLFSLDISPIYESLKLPVWMVHGVRGDFVDYRGAKTLGHLSNWEIHAFETGALPHFEVPDDFFASYDRFLERADPPTPS
ncbi:MAG: alpha/beta hydrolase [Myxococcota bacterium]